MKKVESKYKNPDKFIERLKTQLDEAWKATREANEDQGNWVLTFSKNTEFSINATSRRLGEFRTNDIVIITGRIKKITEELDSSEIEYDKITVRRKESQ